MQIIGFIMDTTPDEDGASSINIQQTKAIAPGGKLTSDLAALPGSVDLKEDCLEIKIKNITLFEYPEPEKDEDSDKDKKKPHEFSKENSDTQGESGYYESKDSGSSETQGDVEWEESKEPLDENDFNQGYDENLEGQ